MGRRRQACSQLSLLWTEVTPPLLATVPNCSLLQFICYLVCKLFSYISYGSTYLPTYFYLDLIWPEACCEKSFLQLKQPDIQLVMAIQTGAISCAHIFSCAGSVQASDLSHTYLLAAGQVKEHCRLSNTVMCHGVAKSNGRPTRNLTRTRKREKIWLKWAGPDRYRAWWSHYLKDKKSVLLLGIYRP